MYIPEAITAKEIPMEKPCMPKPPPCRHIRYCMKSVGICHKCGSSTESKYWFGFGEVKCIRPGCKG